MEGVDSIFSSTQHRNLGKIMMKIMSWRLEIMIYLTLEWVDNTARVT